MKFSVDSNYLVCVLQSWNINHQATLADLERRLEGGQQLHLIPHTLLETYSVMTRMPDPFRKPQSVVLDLLGKNFSTFPLTDAPTAVWSLLEDVAKQGIGGGRTYDYSIAFSAHQAGMKQLVTWNVKHFEPHSFVGLEIVMPRGL